MGQLPAMVGTMVSVKNCTSEEVINPIVTQKTASIAAALGTKVRVCLHRGQGLTSPTPRPTTSATARSGQT